MLDDLPFISVEGPKKSPEIRLMALSTCGFCKKGMIYLEEVGYAYKYIFLDQIDPVRKGEAKDEFLAQFGKPLSYPTLILDGREIIIGYIREVWEEKLGAVPG